jgi:ketosteroid isomerase-like protein
MRLVLAAALLALGTTAALTSEVWADATSQGVLDRHVAAMKAGNLDAVMADYADDALVIAPHGIAPGQTSVAGNDVFSGKAEARKLFAVLTDKGHHAAMQSMTSTYEQRGNDIVLMHWVQFKGQPNQASGTDTWIIRGNKVIAQVVAVDPAPPAPAMMMMKPAPKK